MSRVPGLLQEGSSTGLVTGALQVSVLRPQHPCHAVASGNEADRTWRPLCCNCQGGECSPERCPPHLGLQGCSAACFCAVTAQQLQGTPCSSVSISPHVCSAAPSKSSLLLSPERHQQPQRSLQAEELWKCAWSPWEWLLLMGCQQQSWLSQPGTSSLGASCCQSKLCQPYPAGKGAS